MVLIKLVSPEIILNNNYMNTQNPDEMIMN